MAARRRKGRKPPRRPGPRATRKKPAARKKPAPRKKTAARKKPAARKAAPARRKAKPGAGKRVARTGQRTAGTRKRSASTRKRPASAKKRTGKKPTAATRKRATTEPSARKRAARPRKAPAKAAPPRERLAAGVPIEVGVVTHWYGHVSAAVVRLSHPIHRGDTIHVRGAHTDHVQQVESLARDGTTVDEGLPGQELGLRLEARARAGDRVYRVSW